MHTVNGKRYQTMNQLLLLSEILTENNLWQGTIHLRHNEFVYINNDHFS